MSSPGPQNMGTPYNHSGSGLQHESDIRAALPDTGAGGMSRRAVPTANVLKHRPDRPPDHKHLPPTSPCSGPNDGKAPTLSPDSASHPQRGPVCKRKIRV